MKTKVGIRQKMFQFFDSLTDWGVPPMQNPVIVGAMLTILTFLGGMIIIFPVFLFAGVFFCLRDRESGLAFIMGAILGLLFGTMIMMGISISASGSILGLFLGAILFVIPYASMRELFRSLITAGAKRKNQWRMMPKIMEARKPVVEALVEVCMASKSAMDLNISALAVLDKYNAYWRGLNMTYSSPGIATIRVHIISIGPQLIDDELFVETTPKGA